MRGQCREEHDFPLIEVSPGFFDVDVACPTCGGELVSCSFEVVNVDPEAVTIRGEVIGDLKGGA